MCNVLTLEDEEGDSQEIYIAKPDEDTAFRFTLAPTGFASLNLRPID